MNSTLSSNLGSSGILSEPANGANVDTCHGASSEALWKNEKGTWSQTNFMSVDLERVSK